MKENKIIIITAFLNLVVAFLKLISGITFSFSTLIADSIQSFIDFFTDITSIIANKVGKRRANKTYPFGYGQVYYLANMFTSFLLFLIGIFILYQFFFFKGHFEPSISIAIVLLIVLFLKYVVVKLLQSYGKSFKSELMIEASKESQADFVSTCVVLGVLYERFQIAVSDDSVDLVIGVGDDPVLPSLASSGVYQKVDVVRDVGSRHFLQVIGTHGIL